MTTTPNTAAEKPKRDRGEGRFYLRGATWWVQYSHRGRVFRESTHSRKESEAKKLLRQRLGEIGTGTHKPDAEKVTFQDLEARLVADYARRENRSARRMQQAMAHLRETFGQDRALDITTDRLTAYVDARIRAKAAKSTVAYELAMLRRAFTLARSVLPTRPELPELEIKNTRTGFFEEPEFRALVAELPPPLRPVMVFAYFTGWRMFSEILPLRWSQVDLAAGVVRLEPGSTKNREGREFPVGVHPELAALLQAQWDATQALNRRLGAVVPWVFHRNGAPIRDIRAAWDGACKRAGLVGMIRHDFRRTAVRNLERAGVSRSVAMKLTGHKTEAVYRRYAITSAQDMAEGVAKLAALQASQERTVLPFRASA